MKEPASRLLFLTACLVSFGEGRLHAQASPVPITFTSGSWQLTLGGYFKLDLIHGFDPNSSPDTFDPRGIPVDGTEGTNTRIHARDAPLAWDGRAGRRQGPAALPRWRLLR